MERAPFSQAGLRPEEIGRETNLVVKSLDAVQEVVKEIDFQVIDNIFLDIYKKIYPEIPPKDLKQIFALEGVYPVQVTYSGEVDLSHYGSSFMNSQGRVLGYRYLLQKLKINAREVVNEQGEIDEEMRLFLVKMLIHEIVHIRTTKAFKGLLPNTLDEHTGIEKKSMNTQSKITGVGSFSSLNEALTEIIADGIYSEYFARTGRMKEYEAASREIDFAKRQLGYVPERLVLQNLVDKIARDLNVSEREIYQALAVEYFKNGDLMRSEILSDPSLSNEVKQLLEQLHRDDPSSFPSLSEDQESKISTFLHKKELAAVKALVGRDYIGEVNKARLVRSGVK